MFSRVCRSCREALEDLEALGAVDVDRLRDDRLTRRVVERCLELLVDAAAAVNAHVAVALGNAAPRDLTESFERAAETGLLSRDLASRLRPSAGIHNAIVHAYVDLDLGRVAAAVPMARTDYRAYLSEVVTFLEQRRRGKARP